MRLFCILSFLLAVSASPARSADFTALEAQPGWKPVTSDGVELRISQDQGRQDRALRLDFDFHGGAGYAIARKELALELSTNFQFTFWVRGPAPVNNLEFKLVDESGDNVWWVNRRNFEFPADWKRVALKKRHFSFAWGPAGGGEPGRIGAIEIAITAGTGGKGTVWIDELSLTELPDTPPSTEPPIVTTSSASSTAARAIDGDLQTSWQTSEDGVQQVNIDLRGLTEFGGLVIHWDPKDFATDYVVDISNISVTRWYFGYEVKHGNGGRDYLFLPEREARYLQLRLFKSSRGRGYGIREITIQPLEWSATPNDFLTRVAGESTRGDYPRYLLGEQSYWTVIGVDGDSREALFNEDGMIESGKGSFSIEPFLWIDGRLFTWADVEKSHTLAESYLPIPSVAWRCPAARLTVTATASGNPERSTAYVRYRLETDVTKELTLFLTIRPLQVNPPWQFLGTPGGFAPIREIQKDDGAITINGSGRVVPLTRADAFGAATLDEGNIVEFLRRGEIPNRTVASDSGGFISGALAFQLVVKPGSPAEVTLAIPLHEESPIENKLPAAIEDWRKKLNRVTIRLPSSQQYLVDTLRSTLAYVLVNHDGPAIQPGSRSYERSWIRDGSLTSAALLRFGLTEVVREFIEWYAPYQFPSGKVPCCVDRRGADPVPEHDSHGQLIFLIAEYYRYTRDRQFIEKMWPHVKKAVDYIDSLRHERMTAEYESGEKRAYFGLVPQSISHEGYSAKPMHSYWDDFFVLKGLKDATFLAESLGLSTEAARISVMRDEFRRHLLESFRLAMAMHKIDYLPGSVELGDFDATSTTIGIAPGGELENLPRAALERTFEKYYEDFVKRRDTDKWDAYTPYELRTVGTFVRLGQKQRAHELLDWFFRHHRPPGWNAWGEVVWREPRTPKFVGDIPHTWVGSDFIRSFTDMLAYEQDDGSLAVGSGIPSNWVTSESGIRVENLQTHYGALNFEMRGSADEVRVRISGSAASPRGFVIHSPHDRPPKTVWMGKRKIESADRKTVRIASIPAEVIFRY